MGLIVVDAGVVVAVLDGRDGRRNAATAALWEIREGSSQVVLPASAYAELLVAPSRAGTKGVATVNRFLGQLPVRVEPVSPEIAARAAALKATHGDGLRLSDAFVAATAEVISADGILTTHPSWPKLRVPVEVLRRRRVALPNGRAILAAYLADDGH